MFKLSQKKISIAFCLLILTVLPMTSWAKKPTFCQKLNESDNFSLGSESVILNHSIKLFMKEPACFDAGVQKGQELLAQNANCGSEFEAGKKQGFMATDLSAGSECYDSGYYAGLAQRHDGARKKDANLVGTHCVDKFLEGYKDFQHIDSVQNPSYQVDPVLRECYLAGFYYPILF